MIKHKVVTFQSEIGNTIDLTLGQIQWLTDSGVWPRDAAGYEYRTVIQSAHRGFGSLHDNHLKKLVGLPYSTRPIFNLEHMLNQEPFAADPDDQRSAFYDLDVDPALARGIARNQSR